MIPMPPESIRDQLRAMMWDTVSQGDSVFAEVCPMCGAMIPAPSLTPRLLSPNAKVVNRREQHIEHHAQVSAMISATNERLDSLERWREHEFQKAREIAALQDRP